MITTCRTEPQRFTTELSRYPLLPCLRDTDTSTFFSGATEVHESLLLVLLPFYHASTFFLWGEVCLGGVIGLAVLFCRYVAFFTASRVMVF